MHSASIITRLRAVLPARWFADETPVLDALLAGLADAWVRLHDLLDAARRQMRLRTAEGAFLDLAARDFMGLRLQRRRNEPDDLYRPRLLAALRRSRATRSAVEVALQDLMGATPTIFEPTRPADTGAYNVASGYGVAGGWGSLDLPFQSFITVRRPRGQGIAEVAGYGTGGPLARTASTTVAGAVTDADIMAAVADALPAGSIAWTRIVP